MKLCLIDPSSLDNKADKDIIISKKINYYEVNWEIKSVWNDFKIKSIISASVVAFKWKLSPRKQRSYYINTIIHIILYFFNHRCRLSFITEFAEKK